MNRDQARALIAQTFTQAFDRARFGSFTINLLNHVDESKAQAWNSQYVKDAFKDDVHRYERLGTYTSPDSEKLDVLIVHLTKDSKLERARTAIRNFVAHHLKTRDEKEAALVAFVSPTEKQWRFSYVKMEYATVEKESGKIGVEARLTPARRFSYLVGEGESCHTAQTRFLGPLQDTATDPTLADIEEAFSVEAVTKEFFTKYAELFGNIHKALEKLVEREKSIREEFKTKGVNTVDFAKKLMGQIVFLYFVQKKGWLGVAKGQNWGAGPHDFLRQLANGEHGKYENFFNDILEPLFYDTLATDRGHEAWCKHFKCRIPFLNGGLFEPPGGYDWRNVDIALPNKLFINTDFVEEGITGTGVLDVFDRYNFTVNEAEPLEKEVAIDPEMLGKVFENLIEENRRKGLGAYYTPREIVHYMCQESLINYLDTALNATEEFVPPTKPKQTKLFAGSDPKQTALKTIGRHELVSRADIETLIHLGDQAALYEAARMSGTTSYALHLPKSIEKSARLIDEKLAEITICDPAVGSGAFPVGMMTEIVRARSSLTPYFNDVQDRTPYHFKRHAIQSCLYGVDIDPGAVEIAKLRLWLSLVVDEEDVQQIKPLPNLDYKVVTGNSLLGVERDVFNNHLFEELEELKPSFFDESDRDKKSKLKAHIETLIHQLTNGNEVFDFEIYFSEVFHAKGGFDVVIANPPYLGEKGNKDTFRLIASGPLGQRYYKRKMDLFYFFFHIALDRAKAGGTVCVITTSYWITADGALTLRNDLKSRATINQLINFGECKLFASAQGQHNIVTQLTKGLYDAAARTVLTKRAGDLKPEALKSILSGGDPETEYFRLSQKQLFDGPENQIRLSPTSALSTQSSGPNGFDFQKIDGRSVTLENAAEHVFMGVQTGCDIVTKQLVKTAIAKGLIRETQARHFEPGTGIYVVTKFELKQLGLTRVEMKDCVRPFYKNSEIGRYYTPPQTERFLLYVDSQTDINEYPNIKAHLSKFRPLLAAREQAVAENHNWFWIRGSKRDCFSYRDDAVVVPYRAIASRFSICCSDIYGAGDLYFISFKREYKTRALLGFLNSSLVLYHLSKRGKRKGKIIEYYKNPLEKIPVHRALLEDANCINSFERIVESIINAKTRNAEADTSALERKIDRLVYDLYALTSVEIKRVEESTT